MSRLPAPSKIAPKAIGVAPAPRASKLGALRTGLIAEPVRLFLQAPEGLGKSTFASGAPSPIFLPTDSGTAHLDVARLPKPETIDDVYNSILDLTNEKHDFQTLVFDVVNGLEPIIFEDVTGGRCSIEDYKKGFGKGYVAAVDRWRKIVMLTEQLWTARKMNIVFLSHVATKTFQNPLGADYDQFLPAMNLKASGVLTQWVSYVGFLSLETFVKTDEIDDAKGKAKTTRMRLLDFNPSPHFTAKWRGTPPKAIPVTTDARASWQKFEDAVNLGPRRLAEAQEGLRAALAELNDPAIEAEVREFITGGSSVLDDTLQAITEVQTTIDNRKNENAV